MQRYSEPTVSTPPSTPPSTLPSTPPRRGDLRQPTINSFAPFSRSDDEDQLEDAYGTIRDLIREVIEFEDAEAVVNNLRGHQDIKDIFNDLDNMEYAPSLRRLADILELIDNKVESLEALDELERVNADVDMSLDDIANADTDVETDADTDTDTDAETDAETDSDDEGVRRRLRF